jgi:hypothetical protein
MGTSEDNEQGPITERTRAPQDPPVEHRRIIRNGEVHVWCRSHKTYFCDCVPSVFDVLGLT